MNTITLAVNAAAVAPEVMAGLANVANQVETDLTTHKTILQTAADAGKAALSTLQNPTMTNLLGTKTAGAIADAANTGEAVATAVEPVVPAIEKAIAEIEAFIAKYL